MKYGAEAEKELMTEIWSLGIKDDPLNFVKFVFPWGQRTPPSSISQDQGSGKKKFCEKLQHKYKGTTAK